MEGKIYRGDEVEQIFKINRATLRKWRNQGLIGYSYVAGSYFYSQKDIDNLMAKTHQEPFGN